MTMPNFFLRYSWLLLVLVVSCASSNEFQANAPTTSIDNLESTAPLSTVTPGMELLSTPNLTNEPTLAPTSTASLRPTKAIETVVPHTPTIAPSPSVTRQEVTPTPENWLNDTDLAPDICQLNENIETEQLQLAFTATWDGDQELYTINLDGSSLEQWTFNEVNDRIPVWSPNGNALVFSSVDSINQTAFLSLMDAQSKESIELVDLVGLQGRFATYFGAGGVNWSSDGTRFVFAEDEIYIFDMEDMTLNTLIVSDRLYSVAKPVWNSAGDIAFWGTVDSRGADSRVFIISPDTIEAESLESNMRGYGPRWYPNDPGLLLYTSSFPPGSQKTEFVQDKSLYLFRQEDNAFKRLTSSNYRIGEAVWSPNGQRIAYYDFVPAYVGGIDEETNELTGLHILSVADQEKITIPSNQKVITGLSWAPDSQHLAFFQGREQEGTDILVWDLYVVEVCSQTTMLLVEDVSTYPLSWRP